MAKWMMAAKKADFDKIAEKYGITPVLARILRNRDLVEDEEIRRFLKGDLGDLHEPEQMKDMDRAAELLLSKIEKGEKIRIIGDYDADGICSSYILRKGLALFGAQADVVIPHRMRDGYGLNENLIEEAHRDGIETILTCDNGIAAAPQIQLAKDKQMTVVVTDHHEVPFEERDGERTYLLPLADAVVDPKQPECGYPFKQICGAVVAGKLIRRMLQKETEKPKMPQDNPKDMEAFLEELPVYEAIATICDVMELRDENRIIVKHGLKLLGKTTNLGLKALISVSGLEGKTLTPYHVGFVIGPCLNATGRLDTARRALELLEAKSRQEAVEIAGELKSLNESRKQMTEEGVERAIEQVEKTGAEQDRVLVLYLPDCHESLAGIIAGRIREKYGKPAFILTRAEEGIKGSGRSIEAYSMYEEMTACRELFTKYGGHKMAAGLSLPDEASVSLFRERLNQNCRLTDEDLEPVIHIDVPMPLSYATRDFIRELSILEPFGVGNPRPLFARKGISLLTGRKLGRNKKVGKYQIADENGKRYDMIYFGDLEQLDRFLAEKYGAEQAGRLYERGVSPGSLEINMAYYPELNTYGGRESIQIVMQNYC